MKDVVNVSLIQFAPGWLGQDINLGRKVFCQVAVRKLGYTGASVGRFLGMMMTSSVNRMPRLEEMTELDAWDN